MSIKRILETSKKIQNKIGWVEKAFCTFSMAFIVVINIVGISSRYLFNKPILYVQELTILGGVWMFFIGIGLVFKVHPDITVDFLVKHFPRRLRLISDLFVFLLILFFFTVLIWQTGRFIPLLHGQGESHALSIALELPDEIYYFPIGLGAISILLTILPSFVEYLVKLRSEWGRTPPGGKEVRE
jgi:TRAP-type C4-dicarboxylate transport system permease small subunit